MESLRIRTGQVRLQILDDMGNERGIFTFNPDDIESAKRVLSLQEQFNTKYDEFKEKAKLCETTTEKADLLIESIDYFRLIIDKTFGEGTSELLFGDAKTFSMIDDFIQGIIPYYKKASEKRIAKYDK